MSESNTKQMIQLNHVKFGYSDTEVLEEINLTIHEGEYVVLTLCILFFDFLIFYGVDLSFLIVDILFHVRIIFVEY